MDTANTAYKTSATPKAVHYAAEETVARGKSARSEYGDNSTSIPVSRSAKMEGWNPPAETETFCRLVKSYKTIEYRIASNAARAKNKASVARISRRMAANKHVVEVALSTSAAAAKATSPWRVARSTLKNGAANAGTSYSNLVDNPTADP